jgi:hypothetical protein
MSNKEKKRAAAAAHNDGYGPPKGWFHRFVVWVNQKADSLEILVGAKIKKNRIVIRQEGRGHADHTRSSRSKNPNK